MRSLPFRITVILTATGIGCDNSGLCTELGNEEAADMWCGDSLCDWKVTRGWVVRERTWHSDDSGVLLASSSAIEKILFIDSRRDPITGRDAPFLCAAGRRLGQPGAPCTSPVDCASGRCRGEARRQCVDARRCTSDEDRPYDVPRMQGECQTVGIQGGICD